VYDFKPEASFLQFALSLIQNHANSMSWVAIDTTKSHFIALGGMSNLGSINLKTVFNPFSTDS